ncbi:MAG: hypothetical protein J5873_00555 [Bacteroidales bacterium]|nr:hypothetical protein [Bacteroidales bacterium]
MKSKHLLHLLMMALLVPGIVNAQNLPANSPKSTSWQEITINSNVSDKVSYYVPICGQFANYATSSQFIIPATSLQQIVGCTVGQLTFYTSPNFATRDYGDATFKVYMLEVPNDQFASTEFFDWESLTQVYEGTLSVSNSQMVVDLDNDFSYSGDNLLIGFDLSQTGTGVETGWLYQITDKQSSLYSIWIGEGSQPVIIEGENQASY